MRVEGVPLARFAGVFLRELVLSYVFSSIAVTGVAVAVIYFVTRTAANGLALAVLAGLWLSLWLAPAVASITSSRKLRLARGNDA